MNKKDEHVMDTDLQQTLLHLFRQISDDLDSTPDIPIEHWQEGSSEWEIMTSLQRMLQRFAQSKQEARKNEERFSLAIQGANDGLWDWDLRSNNVYFSPRWKSMLGYSDDEIAPHFDAWQGLIHPDDREFAQTTIQSYLDGQRASYRLEHRLRHKDGSYRWILARGTLLRDEHGKPYRMAGSHTDISDRKQMEEQLRGKEEQYRSIFEATTDAFIIVDLDDGHVVEANPAACRIYGYSYDEIIGLPPEKIVHPDVLPFFLEKAIPSVRAGGSYVARGKNLRKDGSTFPIDVHETAFMYQGKLHMLVVLRDITEQVQAEAQLREKEAQYRSVFEASADGLVINDLEDGHVVEANPAMCSMHGYSYQEFMALHPRDFIHPNSHRLFIQFLNSVRNGQQYQTRALDVRKDGVSFPVDVHGTTFTYKGKPHVLAIVRDITDQVRAERQLREKEEQYRSIFEATTDALLIADLDDGHIVEANPAACNIYGYSYEEMIGLPPEKIIHPDALPNYLENALPHVREGDAYHTRGRDLRKDGSTFPTDVHETAFMYQGKLHMLAVVRDITELVQAYQLLEERVEERTRELSTLLEISHTVSSTIELKPLLGLVLDQLKRVADYTGSSFSFLEGENFVLVENRGPAPLHEALQLHLPIKLMGPIWEMFCRREHVLIADVRADTPLALAFRTWMGERMETTFRYIRAWMGIPLMLKDRVSGMLTLSSREPDFFTPRHAALAVAIANQAAVALENSRLYWQAQELAVLEERQRLARELHDSVSQALYGITLGTHTARALLSRDPSKVAEPLDYVLTQAEAALTEMRALIFELRPESLETDGLMVALNKQGAALQARHGITVSMEIAEEPDIALKVKQELYRIVQEALHNIAKHAHASDVQLILHVHGEDTEGLVLEIRDNGVGFDTDQSFPGHLGLQSMRERVLRLGGLFDIESAPGQGTRIRAQLPKNSDYAGTAT